MSFIVVLGGIDYWTGSNYGKMLEVESLSWKFSDIDCKVTHIFFLLSQDLQVSFMLYMSGNPLSHSSSQASPFSSCLFFLTPLSSFVLIVLT
jgi:hypothetical protein